mgnify:FL=1
MLHQGVPQVLHGDPDRRKLDCADMRTKDGTFADLAKRQEAVGSPHDAEFFEVSFGELLCGRGMNALSLAGVTESNEVFFLEVRVTANLGDELGRQ